jgi:hypothetical protein
MSKKKEYQDTLAERKNGYLRQRGENAGSKIALAFKSPKGIQVRSIRTERLARRFINSCPWLEKFDYSILNSFCHSLILESELFNKIENDGGAIRTKDGQPHPGLLDRRSEARLIGDLGMKLGLAPLSRLAMKSLSRGSTLQQIDLTRVEEIMRAREKTR